MIKNKIVGLCFLPVLAVSCFATAAFFMCQLMAFALSDIDKLGSDVLKWFDQISQKLKHSS